MKTKYHLLLITALILFVAFVIISSPSATGTVSAASGASMEGMLKVCKVTSAGGSQAYVVRTGKYVHLGKGRALNLMSRKQNQGLILVRAKVGTRIEDLNIDVGNTNCLN